MITRAPDHLTSIDDDVLHALAARLRAASYDEETVGQAEQVAPGLFDGVRLPVVRFALERRAEPWAPLARLFAYDDVVTAAAAADALGAGIRDALLEAGWLEVDGGYVRSRVRVTPLEGVWVVSDPPEGGGAAVMGPGVTTQELARLLPARSPAAVLDLGCGAGTLALIAARRGAARAVGVDVNPRAIAFAALNARLNGLAAEFRVGDLTAPVAGQRFDLVVCQPPYVVRPDGIAGATYLHGGAWGDEIALAAVAATPTVLAPDGRALFFFDTAVRRDRPLASRLREALGSSAVDLVVLTAPGPRWDLQALAYAAVAVPTLGPAYADEVRRYAAHLDALGAREWVRALAVLQAVPGPPGGRFTVALPTTSLAGLAHPELAGYLAGLSLAAAPDDALAAAHVRVHPAARFVDERAGADPELPAVRSIRFAKGALAADREITDAGAALFHLLHDSDRVADAVERYAALCEAPVAEVRHQVLTFVREGLSRGLLRAGYSGPPQNSNSATLADAPGAVQ